MGTILNAKCSSCGFTHRGIRYGSGFTQQVPFVPAMRTDTGDFVVRELVEDDNLRFYHLREMYKDPIEDYGIENMDISLNPKGNLCPACKEFTMEFEAWGQWD